MQVLDTSLPLLFSKKKLVLLPLYGLVARNVLSWIFHIFVNFSTKEKLWGIRKCRRVQGGLSGNNEIGLYYSMLLLPQVPPAVFS